MQERQIRETDGQDLTAVRKVLRIIGRILSRHDCNNASFETKSAIEWFGSCPLLYTRNLYLVVS